MKPVNYFVLLSFSLLFLNPVFSQNQTTLGATAGVNFSKINLDETNSAVGYYAGLRSQIPIKGKFSLVSNLIYSLKNWQFEPFPPNEPAGTMNHHYLDLQVLGNYALNQSISIGAGIEAGTLLKTKREPDADLFEDIYEKGDFSILAGISYRILKSTRIDVRYLHGISYLFKGNLTDANGNDLGEFKEGNFRVIQIGLSTDIIKCKKGEPKKV